MARYLDDEFESDGSEEGENLDESPEGIARRVATDAGREYDEFVVTLSDLLSSGLRGQRFTDVGAAALYLDETRIVGFSFIVLLPDGLYAVFVGDSPGGKK